MKKMEFKAYAVTNEIDLNKIAIQNNIPKKYTWEEPLVLQGQILSSVLGKQVEVYQEVMIFAFGSVVFINISAEDIPQFLEYLRTFRPEIDMKNWKVYSDDYELRINPAQEEIEFTDQYVVVQEFEWFHFELISTVIAKSVALEKTEAQLEKILDRLENIIDRLEKGKLRISDKELARTTARIVRHEYNTIAYIMILDKPDSTWANSTAESFYNQMGEFFELNDRYEILKQKTNILNHIMDGFSSISHSIRGLFVEWVIVLLIVLEVILMIADFFK